jgi:hypothetical protein
MKYFTQLIKSYSRLHEAAQQLDPAAQQKALDYYAQANSKLIPLGGGQAPEIPVKELGGLIYKNREGKVIFNGFPGARPAREVDPQGRGPARQNFTEFVKMLSGGQQPATGDGSMESQTAGVAIPQLLPAGKADPKAERVSELEAEIVDSRKLLKLIEDCDTEDCNTVRSLIDRLNNKSKGSIVDTFNRASKIITACISQGWAACKREVDKKSQVHKDAGYRGFQKAINILMAAKERAAPGESPTLTTEEEAILNNTISISTVGGFTKVALIDDSGNGMLITQYNKRSKMISASLLALLPGLKNSKGENFKFNSAIDAFIEKKAIAQRGSFARGFLYEKLVLASNKYVNCQAAGDIGNRRKCVKEVSDELLSYVEGQENVTDALRDIVASLEESGEIATVVDDELTNGFVNEVVIPTVGRGGTSEDILMELAKVNRRLGALAVMGDIIRRAPRSENNATRVGKGRRADNIEIYPTEEAAKAALDRMGLPENIKNKISIEFNEEFGGFTIGNGLKFTSSGDDIKAGQVAADSILEAENNPEDPDIKRWHTAMETHMGVTAEHRGRLKRKIERLERFSDRLKNLPESVKTKDSNGKEVTLNQREQAIKMVTENLMNTLGVDTSDELVIEALSLFSESSMEGREWEETCDLVANSISKANLRNKLYSGDLKDFDAAVDDLLTMTAYAGVAGDNPMLTVARAKTGVLYTTAHNEQMALVRAHVDNVRNEAKKIKDPEARIKFLKKNIDINTKSISISGKYRLDLDKYDSKGFHIGIEAFKDKATTTAHSAKTAQGQEAPRPENASTVIDRDQLMKFLVEQKTTLDRMINIIARDDHN